jgi:hypothetical protein
MTIRSSGGVRGSCLRLPAAWWGALGVLIGLAAAGAGLRHAHAQAAARPVESSQSAASRPESPGQGTESPPAPTAPQAVNLSNGAVSAEQQRKQQVSDECANLLKMATDLKAAIDKTTQDQLSVAVVRKAGEIEQFARKVRGDTRQTAGKD